MGISPSINKPKVLASMQTWPIEKIQSIIHKFIVEEYQFGLKIGDVQSLLDIDATDAEELMISLSRNKKTSTLVNAVVILAAMIVIAEPSAATIETRKKTLFSIMDFNGLGRISLDELEILLFCVSTASACITDRKSEIPKSSRVKELTQMAADKLKKNEKTKIQYAEYAMWSNEIANEKHANINEIVTYMDKSKFESLPNYVAYHHLTYDPFVENAAVKACSETPSETELIESHEEDQKNLKEESTPQQLPTQSRKEESPASDNDLPLIAGGIGLTVIGTSLAAESIVEANKEKEEEKEELIEAPVVVAAAEEPSEPAAEQQQQQQQEQEQAAAESQVESQPAEEVIEAPVVVAAAEEPSEPAAEQQQEQQEQQQAAAESQVESQPAEEVNEAPVVVAAAEEPSEPAAEQQQQEQEQAAAESQVESQPAEEVIEAPVVVAAAEEPSEPAAEQQQQQEQAAAESQVESQPAEEVIEAPVEL